MEKFVTKNNFDFSSTLNKKLMRIIVGITCLFFSANANAQDTTGPFYGFRLGLTAHPTFGKISAEGGKSNGTSLGFSYGLMTDFNFAEHYSMSTGITITTINGKSTEINAMPYHAVVSSIAPIEYDLKYKMKYIEIPLMLKLKTSKIGAIKWFGQFGIANDFKIKARQDAKNRNGVLADDIDSKSWTRFYRAGLLIGGGGEFDVDDHTSLMAGLTLNNGLTNITTDKKNIRNHYLALNIGVFF